MLSQHIHRPLGLRSAAPLLAICGLLAVMIVAGAVLLIVDMRKRTILSVERNLTGLSTILADQADRALQAMEITQESVINGFRDSKVENPSGYAAAATKRSLHHELRSRIISLPQINAITVIDHTGKLLNFSRYWPIPDINIADRDFFKAFIADQNLQRVVSSPVRNRGDNHWTIYVARKVSAPDGTFLGLVLGAVQLEYFTNLYSQISPSSDHVVSVFRNDGMLLVRHPHVDGTIGSFFPKAGASIIATTNPSGGIIRNTSPIDKRERLISARPLTKYPLILSVSRTVDASLAPIRYPTLIIIGAAILLVGYLATLSIALLLRAKAQERLTQAEAARAAAEERMRGERDRRMHNARFGIALNSMAQGLCLFDHSQGLVVMNASFIEMFYRNVFHTPRTTITRRSGRANPAPYIEH